MSNKYNYKFKIVSLLTLFLLITACSKDNSAGNAEDKITITVSAAASLMDALNEIAETFTEENQNIQVDYNFGGSGALRQQIIQGAPVDMFFSASENDFQAVIDEGFIAEENALNLLMNELVLIVPEGDDTVTSFGDLGNANQIAIAHPASVPAGAYSAAVFEGLGVWEELEELFVYAEDVRTVLTYAETGNVDAGTVYRTDAMTSKSIEVVDVAPADLHDPIIYLVGMMNETADSQTVENFYEYLQSDAALNVFEGYGFVIK